jgi:hypothetical protein
MRVENNVVKNAFVGISIGEASSSTTSSAAIRNSPGFDFMKPFWPEFTGETQKGRIKVGKY